jgi:hypothetical protein
MNTDGKVDFFDTWLGDQFDDSYEGPALSDSFHGSRRTGGTGTKSKKSLSEHKPAKPTGNRDPGPSGAEVAKAAAAKATKKAKEKTSGLSSTEKKGGAALDQSYGISGLSKGGLMGKKKK